MRVSFLLPDEDDLGRLRSVDPDRDLQFFQRGERMWILQTYLRLQRAGHAAELSNRVTPGALVIFHVKHRREVTQQWHPESGAVLVGVRADNRSCEIADFEILQNDHDAAPGRRLFVPHWPQPGIIPRPAARGTRITRIAYHGFNNNLDARFLAPDFQGALAAAGIEWLFDSVEFAGRATDTKAVAWHDYSAIDLLLAVRPPDRDLHLNKPATKLYNAWFGRAPALLGPEYAYRSLRRSELDYLEVGSPADALRAIELLRREPERYRAMVENGGARAREFSSAAILERWCDLLYRELPELARARRVRKWHGRSLTLKKYAKRYLPTLDRD